MTFQTSRWYQSKLAELPPLLKYDISDLECIYKTKPDGGRVQCPAQANTASTVTPQEFMLTPVMDNWGPTLGPSLFSNSLLGSKLSCSCMPIIIYWTVQMLWTNIIPSTHREAVSNAEWSLSVLSLGRHRHRRWMPPGRQQQEASSPSFCTAFVTTKASFLQLLLKHCEARATVTPVPSHPVISSFQHTATS